ARTVSSTSTRRRTRIRLLGSGATPPWLPQDSGSKALTRDNPLTTMSGSVIRTREPHRAGDTCTVRRLCLCLTPESNRSVKGTVVTTRSGMKKSVAALIVLMASLGSAQSFKAPDFDSEAVWIDTGEKAPHSIKGYRGHVLLIDFWEYTCINCIRD